MSLRWEASLWCDSPGCLQWHGCAATSAAEARSVAAIEGWWSSGGRDFCPRHAAAAVEDRKTPLRGKKELER